MLLCGTRITPFGEGGFRSPRMMVGLELLGMNDSLLSMQCLSACPALDIRENNQEKDGVFLA